MIVYDVATKVLDTELFPQPNIAGLISGITFVVLQSGETFTVEHTHTHTHTNTHTCTHARTHAHAHTHTHTHTHTHMQCSANLHRKTLLCSKNVVLCM